MAGGDFMVRQTWQDLLETYDTQKDTRCICPIAHTQIIANIGIMLDLSVSKDLVVGEGSI